MKVSDLTEDALNSLSKKELLAKAQASNDPVQSMQWLLIAFDNDVAEATRILFDWHCVTDVERAALGIIMAEYLSSWRENAASTTATMLA